MERGRWKALWGEVELVSGCEDKEEGVLKMAQGLELGILGEGPFGLLDVIWEVRGGR